MNMKKYIFLLLLFCLKYTFSSDNVDNYTRMAKVRYDFEIHTKDDGLLYAHSAILANSDEYFYLMLTNNMRETNEKKVSFLDISPATVELMLRVIYSNGKSPTEPKLLSEEYLELVNFTHFSGNNDFKNILERLVITDLKGNNVAGVIKELLVYKNYLYFSPVFKGGNYLSPLLFSGNINANLVEKNSNKYIDSKWLHFLKIEDDNTVTKRMLSGENENEVVITLVGHNSRVSKASFGDDGKVIGTVDNDWKIITWDNESGKKINVFENDRKPKSVNFNGDLTRVFTIHENGRIIVLDSYRQKKLLDFFVDHSFYSITFCQDKDKIFLFNLTVGNMYILPPEGLYYLAQTIELEDAQSWFLLRYYLQTFLKPRQTPYQYEDFLKEIEGAEEESRNLMLSLISSNESIQKYFKLLFNGFL